MALPVNHLPLGEGLDPSGQPGAIFYVDKATVESIEQHGPEWKYEDARFVYEAVQDPDAIFKDLLRHGQGENLCYSVRPTVDPDDPENSSLPRYGFVFMIHVRGEGWGFVVFDWEWREEDADSPGHPIGWQSDFGARTWHKT